MYGKEELLEKIDNLIAEINSFYLKNQEDCKLLRDLDSKKVRFRLSDGSGNVYIRFSSTSNNNPLLHLQNDLTTLKENIEKEDFLKKQVSFNNKYKDTELECKNVFSVITMPNFLLAKRTNIISRLIKQFESLNQNLREDNLLVLSDQCIDSVRLLSGKKEGLQDLSEENFNLWLNEFKTKLNNISAEHKFKSKELNESKEKVSLFDQKFIELQQFCKLIRHSPIPDLKKSKGAAEFLQEKIDFNNSHIDNNRQDLDTMQKAVQEYINNLKLKFPYVFEGKQSADLRDVLRFMRTEKLNADDRLSSFQHEYKSLRSCHKNISTSKEIPELPELTSIKDALPEDDIQAINNYIDKYTKHKEQMINDIKQNAISHKINSLQEKASAFSKNLLSEVQTFIQEIEKESLPEQLAKLDMKISELEKRIEEAQNISNTFVISIQKVSQPDGFTQFSIQSFIDSESELKELLRNPEKIPEGFLLCIKDMALWTQSPSKDEWQNIVKACKAAFDNQSWARQAGELYLAIYKYRESSRVGNADLEDFKAFKQSICMKIFTDETLDYKKSFIETQAIDKLPHKNAFLRWLDATIKWLELKVSSSASIGIFSTKSQKEIRAELNKILSSANESPSIESKNDSNGLG